MTSLMMNTARSRQRLQSGQNMCMLIDNEHSTEFC